MSARFRSRFDRRRLADLVFEKVRLLFLVFRFHNGMMVAFLRRLRFRYPNSTEWTRPILYQKIPPSPPKPPPFRQATTGLYIKLAQFGFGKTESPALETRIARQCALCPSFELARDELKREGLKLSTKAVRRVAQQCGEDLLQLRTLQLQQWRAGTLTSTNEVAGLYVTVQIDAGHTRIRGELQKATLEPETRDENGQIISDAPGRSKARAKQSFDAEWREPKLVTGAKTTPNRCFNCGRS